MKRNLYGLILLICIIPSLIIAGTTGKIAGIVNDANTGEPLPGVNVLVQGTLLGAATDLDGYYVILNIEPGTYTVQVMMVGYATQNLLNVRVMIDQTTNISVEMAEETLTLSTIEVIAERPVIEKDVAASRANISIEEIESIPIVSINEAVGLQAGIRGLEVRGGGEDETAFIVNGVNLRDSRTNNPITVTSYSAVEEIQVQSGGFTAEYGDFRSGLVNVVTKEGYKDRYSFSLIGRYKAPSPKHFGPSPNSPDSYWIRPYVDDGVAWVGTKNGAWGRHLQTQFPEFEGWNSISEKTLQDDDPSNDLTPEAAQQVYLWQHRRELDIQEPDYVIDFSFGGPVPLISQDLGNLRFNLSYRRSQSMYLIPLSRDGFQDYSWQLKLTSDIAPGMKLMVDGFIAKQSGSNYSRSGLSGIFNSTWRIANALSEISFIEGRMFGTDYWNPTEIDYTSFGIRFNHALSAKTFYEVKFSRVSSDYWTVTATPRDNTLRYLFGDSYYVDESPINWEDEPSSGINGMRMGVGMSNSRDTTFVAEYTLAANLTSQIDRYNNIRAGFEFVLTDYRPNYARFDRFLTDANSNTKFEETPIRVGVYAQDKLEFKGMIATVGLRLDYFNAGASWYNLDDPYTRIFSRNNNFYETDQTVEKESAKHVFTLSPRLAVSFPVSEYSKLYFNYGHFRQLPDFDDLFLRRVKLEPRPTLQDLGDPNLPQEKTIAYELGYEHSIFDEYLIRLAGYYKDVSNIPADVTYESDDLTVIYDRREAIFYEDIRGFEFTFSKKGGNWLRGFINYTYQVESSGYFGLARDYSENPVEQRNNINEYDPSQTKNVPRPYARANIDLFTPMNFGPEFSGIYPLAEWRVNFLASWRSGQYSTWVGGQTVPGIKFNVQWRDEWNVDLRMSKNFDLGMANVEFFMDIQNIFNFKYMNPGGYGFVDAPGLDRKAYFRSLHLPGDTEGTEQFGYVNIPGDDQPGDYRKTGVEYVPIVAANDYNGVINPFGTDELYYFTRSAEGFHGSGYYEYIDDGSGIPKFQQVAQSRIDQILEDKAYIDMPNLTHFTFLNPRQIFWGIRLSFDF